MSETNAQEPTMEEILASIRKIISEDDAPAAAAEAPAAVPAASPAPALAATAPAAAVSPPEPTPVAAAPPPPVPTPEIEEEEDDVLELNEPIETAPASASARYHETLGDLDVFSSSPTAPTGFKPEAPVFPAEPLVGSYASETSAGHFGALARSVSMPREGRSLEDVVRELLKPMLRDWLDQHLPAIVEARVQAEVERIARRNEY